MPAISMDSFSEEKHLNLFIIKGNDGLLRVETRVASRKVLDTFRYPILLPSKHHLVKKLTMDEL